MPDLYGLPQPLTGSELVTIQQTQNGQLALCSMPLSDLIQIITLNALAASLPKTAPTTSGAVWNNNGVLSVTN